MDGYRGIMLSELSQRKTDTDNFTYMWNLKKTKQTTKRLIETEPKGMMVDSI